jgi:hypothetical protein
MYCVLFAAVTVFFQFHPIRIVAAILFGGVIAFLAIVALQSDHRTDVFLLGSHFTTLLSTYVTLNEVKGLL